MERIQRGLRLTRVSWEVLKQDRELLVLPVLAFISLVIVAGTLFGVGAVIGLPAEGEQPGLAHYLLLAVLYLVGTFVSVFFNAAMIGAASIRLNGGDPTVSDGLRIARDRLGKIFAWSLLAASVGLVLRMIEERVGWLGRIVISVLGAAWAAITFFVVPVLLYEELPTVESVKRSARLFRERWGEQFTGDIAIGLVTFVGAVLVVLVAAALGVLALPLGIVVGVLGLGALAAVAAALSGIFRAALYRYATTGETVGGFTEQDLWSAFRRKRG